MDEHLQRETANLTKSWMQHDASMLRDYLVSGVEDPRINVQSLLSRHYLIEALCGNRFHRLVEQELRFALVMNWAVQVGTQAASSEDFLAIRHALDVGAEDAEGIAVPKFVSATRALLPETLGDPVVPNYIDEWLQDAAGTSGESRPSEEILLTFQRLWTQALPSEPSTSTSLLELACGSANDYRFLHAYGLTRLVDYTGFDLCEKNIANARALFPSARFAVGNALAIDSEDRAFDYGLVHDLFEHLSLAGLERSAAELSRVTRRGLCLGFFNVYEGDDHRVHPVEDYHWNQLSLPRLRELFGSHGFNVQVIHIDTFLKWRFGCSETHNKQAYTLFAERSDSAS